VPLDLLYTAVARGRRRWYEQHPEARRRLSRPVISVGNLSVGGTGKTPLVAQIAEWLVARGERPAILSRGYKRRIADDGVTVVAEGDRVLSDVDHSGDEPLMLARAVPGAIVCVCEDRHLAGVVAERALGATIHLLDDGFQHVQLARDFDILVTQAGEITSERVLPFGRLREGKGAAARADFVVVVGADVAAARAEAWELGVSGFAAAARQPGASGASGAASGALATAGIARPEQFFAMLRDAGVEVKGTLSFPDHHPYSAADVARIAAAAGAAGVDVVATTAKDAVRLEPLGKLPFALRIVPLRLAIDGWDSLTESITAAIARARAVA
jgi:tetraacyldisaccharide 4'-kinase